MRKQQVCLLVIIFLVILVIPHAHASSGSIAPATIDADPAAGFSEIIMLLIAIIPVIVTILVCKFLFEKMVEVLEK